MLYKPKGMRSELRKYSTNDNSKYDCIQQWMESIIDRNEINDNLDDRMSMNLCGRLDKNTKGLLLATNDGTLISLLNLPSIDNVRIYRCNIRRNHSETKFRRLKLLQTQGTLLKKPIGRIFAHSVIPRGRIGNIDTFYDNEESDGQISTNDEVEHSFIPLKKADDEILDLNENENKDKIENEEKYISKYLLNLERETQWDIGIKSGQRHILQRMVGSLGFVCNEIERVGYASIFMDDEPFKKQWILSEKKKKEMNCKMIGNLDDWKNENIMDGMNDQFLQSLVKYNTLELNKVQIEKMWESVGGMNVGVTVRLHSLFERAQRMQDHEFYHFLQNEYGIKI